MGAIKEGGTGMSAREEETQDHRRDATKDDNDNDNDSSGGGGGEGGGKVFDLNAFLAGIESDEDDAHVPTVEKGKEGQQQPKEEDQEEEGSYSMEDFDEDEDAVTGASNDET